MLELPDYLSVIKQGRFAIHADWPAYPIGEGWQATMIAFASFPRRTAFMVEDDIDRALLFRGIPPGGWGSRSVPDYAYVAAFHEDLLDLAERGSLSGIEPVSEREWERRKRDRMRASIRASGWDREEEDPLDHLYAALPDGSRLPVPFTPLGELDDDWRRFVGHDDAVYLTDAAWRELEAVLAGTLKLPPALLERIEAIMTLGLRDTAVRELSVALEAKIREASWTASEQRSWGAALIRAYIAALKAHGWVMPEGLTFFEADLQRSFAFIRNEYMHRLVDMEAVHARALLARLAQLYTAVEMAGFEGHLDE